MSDQVNGEKEQIQERLFTGSYYGFDALQLLGDQCTMRSMFDTW